MTQNQPITISELAKSIKVTDKTIERALKNMKAFKMIERIGSDKGGYWKVIEKWKTDGCMLSKRPFPVRQSDFNVLNDFVFDTNL